MSDLWVTASADVERERNDEMLHRARLGTAECWGVLARSASTLDYQATKAMLAERIEHVCHAIEPNPAQGAVLTAAILDEFDTNFNLLRQAARDYKHQAASTRKPLVHLTGTGLYAGHPLCADKRPGDRGMHAAYAPEKFLTAKTTDAGDTMCPACQNIWNQPDGPAPQDKQQSLFATRQHRASLNGGGLPKVSRPPTPGPIRAEAARPVRVHTFKGTAADAVEGSHSTHLGVQMSRRHYNMIAHVLHNYEGRDARLVDHFANSLQSTSPRFDPARFRTQVESGGGDVSDLSSPVAAMDEKHHALLAQTIAAASPQHRQRLANDFANTLQFNKQFKRGPFLEQAQGLKSSPAPDEPDSGEPMSAATRSASIHTATSVDLAEGLEPGGYTIDRYGALQRVSEDKAKSYACEQGEHSKCKGCHCSCHDSTHTDRAKKANLQMLAKGAQAPFGNVVYADPGNINGEPTTEDGKKRYPLNNEKRIRASHMYLSDPANTKHYKPEHLKVIMTAVAEQAAKQGIQLNQPAPSKVPIDNKKSPSKLGAWLRALFAAKDTEIIDCPICGKPCEGQVGLAEHIEEKHPDNSQFAEKAERDEESEKSERADKANERKKKREEENRDGKKLGALDDEEGEVSPAVPDTFRNNTELEQITQPDYMLPGHPKQSRRRMGAGGMDMGNVPSKQPSDLTGNSDAPAANPGAQPVQSPPTPQPAPSGSADPEAKQANLNQSVWRLAAYIGRSHNVEPETAVHLAREAIARFPHLGSGGFDIPQGDEGFGASDTGPLTRCPQCAKEEVYDPRLNKCHSCGFYDMGGTKPTGTSGTNAPVNPGGPYAR